MIRIFKWIKEKIEKYKRNKKFKKKLDELRKKDPFIYKH